jgi:hypothetical protein
MDENEGQCRVCPMASLAPKPSLSHGRGRHQSDSMGMWTAAWNQVTVVRVARWMRRMSRCESMRLEVRRGV